MHMSESLRYIFLREDVWSSYYPALHTIMTAIQLHSQRYVGVPGFWFDFNKTSYDWWIKHIPKGTPLLYVSF